jgi:hypothetical protein
MWLAKAARHHSVIAGARLAGLVTETRENTWSPKAPVVVASEMRNAWDPKPYPAAAA